MASLLAWTWSTLCITPKNWRGWHGVFSTRPSRWKTNDQLKSKSKLSLLFYVETGGGFRELGPARARAGSRAGRARVCRKRIRAQGDRDRKSTRLNSSHLGISYAVF